MSPPKHLENQLRKGRVIPFVGAGVSMAVRDRTGKPLFPSWKELLMRAAQRIEEERDPRNLAPVVRALLNEVPPDYLLAAKRARSGLGRNWFPFLRTQIAHSFGDANAESISLAKKVWELGSHLVITTNYDKVLRWACPRANDLTTWDVEAPAEQLEALRDNLEGPTVWHLHGHIDNASQIILTPDGYSKLYPTEGDIEPQYKAALKTLQTLLLKNTFLFIGYSLEDHHLGLELKGIDEIFANGSGPHYALIREAEVDRVRNLGLPVEIIPFSDHGPPLLSCLDTLNRIAAEGKAERTAVQPAPKFHLRIYHGPAEQPLVDEMCLRLKSSKLNLLLETQLPLAETQANVAEADAVIVCLSSTAVTDTNFSELINAALTSVADESVNLNHLIAVNGEDSPGLEDIGHYPTIRLFTEEGYEQLLKAVSLAATNSALSRGSRSTNGDRGQFQNDLQVLRFWNRVSSYKPIALIFPDTPPERSTLGIETSARDFQSGYAVLEKLRSILAIEETVVRCHSSHPQIDNYIKSHCCLYIAGRVCNPKAKQLFEQIQHRLVYKFDRTSNMSMGWIAADGHTYDSVLDDDKLLLDYGLVTAAWRLPAGFSPGTFLWAAGSTGYGTEAAAMATISAPVVAEILSRLDPKAGGFQVLVSVDPQTDEVQVLFDTLVAIDLTEI